MDATRDFTVQLAVMTAMHPNLVALELTLFPPGVAVAVRTTVAQVGAAPHTALRTSDQLPLCTNSTEHSMSLSPSEAGPP